MNFFRKNNRGYEKKLCSCEKKIVLKYFWSASISCAGANAPKFDFISGKFPKCEGGLIFSNSMIDHWGLSHIIHLSGILNS